VIKRALFNVLGALALSSALLSLPVQAKSPQITVYQLDCGRIDIADMDPFADDGSYKGVPRQLVDSCFLIRHPEGDLLWEAGVGDQFAGPEGVTYMPGFVAHVPVTLQSQLQALGTDPSKIQFLAFSHEHIDHIGNANALTGATWILNKKEHEWTVAHDGHDGQPPALLTQAMRAKTKLIAGDYDVFDDGAVKIIAAPGHTPGHQVLLVQPTGQQPLILAGDLWHSYENYQRDRVPRFNTSRSETLASMAKVRTLAKKTGARVLISHAPEDFHPIDVNDPAAVTSHQ
jgi:N-acyl homoserine lactone hydrolase